MFCDTPIIICPQLAQGRRLAAQSAQYPPGSMSSLATRVWQYGHIAVTWSAQWLHRHIHVCGKGRRTL
jgi:hypothetical protein